MQFSTEECLVLAGFDVQSWVGEEEGPVPAAYFDYRSGLKGIPGCLEESILRFNIKKPY